MLGHEAVGGVHLADGPLLEDDAAVAVHQRGVHERRDRVEAIGGDPERGGQLL